MDRHQCGWTLWTVAVPLLAALQCAHAADISPLSDFANAGFTREEAFISQVGNGNLVSVDQDAMPGGFVGHYSEVTQTGAGNQALTAQVGDLNRERIIQTGSFNLANVNQNGLRNVLDLTQTGDGNNFSSNQTGNDNSIVFTQLGGVQANLVETGNNNTINMTQPPAGLPLSITLTGGMSVIVK